MNFLKKWLPLIGYKTAINLFLIFVYGSLLILIAFINCHLDWKAHFSLNHITHAENLAWLFIISIASLVYLGIVFIAKAKITYLFIFLNSFGFLWFYFKSTFTLENYSKDIKQIAPILYGYDIGVLGLFIATIIALICFKKYDFTLQQRFLH